MGNTQWGALNGEHSMDTDSRTTELLVSDGSNVQSRTEETWTNKRSMGTEPQTMGTLNGELSMGALNGYRLGRIEPFVPRTIEQTLNGCTKRKSC